MHHEAHVRLVYAHAESVRAHHHTYLPPFPGVLSLLAGERVEPGVVERGADARGFEHRGRLLALATVAHIDYPRPRDSPADVQQLAALVLAAAHDIRQVRPFESAPQHDEIPGFPFRTRGRGELLHYVRRHLRGRGRRKGDHGDVQTLPEPAYLEVVGAEVIAPLGDAVRLVHHYHADAQHVQIGAEKEGREPFGRDVEELEAPVGRVVERRVHLPAVHSRMYGDGADAPGLQVLHLVLHQGDQGRYHERQPPAHHRGHLEADRLASSGGQYRQYVAPFQRGVNDFLLHRAERAVAPIFLQSLKCGHSSANLGIFTTWHGVGRNMVRFFGKEINY